MLIKVKIFFLIQEKFYANEKDDLNMQLKLETDLLEKLTSENNKLKQEVSDKDDQLKAMEEKYEELVR